ncbi:serine palmitoyltransferase component [Arthrobotrys musiformis]|uniref:Serine palmitoyltransferase component n=1 Tax=Arthrobotrys musiformis TaxID=47236 RepID=A0AAV9W7K5_9PEZI
MPRKASSSVSSIIDTPKRATVRTTNKIVQFFASSQKPSPGETKLSSSYPGALPKSAPSISLPTISLSTATGEHTSEAPMVVFSPEEARRTARRNAQFGPLLHSSHKYVSQHNDSGDLEEPIEDEPPYFIMFTTYFSYLILIIFGHVRDFFGKRFRSSKYTNLKAQNGYAALNSDFDNFYVRRLKKRLDDCFSRPITGVPGRYITLLGRESNDYNDTFHMTGEKIETLNMSSYNYLGFAQSEGPCADASEESIRKYGVSAAGTRSDGGTLDLHVDCEALIARFVGKPASILYSMGYGTNAWIFQSLVNKGCLIISDELNHASIRTGARASGAMIDMFKHNHMGDLENKLREYISQGQPRTHRPWKKILVVVEGLYSMEGTMCNLPALVRLREKYGFYLFVDEAHSVGALGPRGRGVCDFFGVDPRDVDILMGTLTKSFGANGGYIAAEKNIIDKLRAINAGVLMSEAPAPGVVTQITSALKMITGELNTGEGEERLQRLAFNSRYLRLGLKRLGFIVLGHDDSPIVPLMLYNPAKMPAFSREMLKRKISVVVVGYPATPLVSSRVRFCLSAAHNKDDLDRLLRACDEVGDDLDLKLSSGIAGGAIPLPEGVTPEMEAERIAKGGKIAAPRWPIEEVIKRGVQDTKLTLR